MVNVLLFIDNLSSGGAQNQITLLAKGLDSKKFRVTILTYYPQNFFKNRLEKAGANILYIPKTSRLGVNVIRYLIDLIHSGKFDVLVSYLDTPNLYAALAIFFSRKKIPLIVSYRSKSNLTNMSYFKKKLKIWVNDQAISIVANSHHERKRWQNYDAPNAYKWQTIYNGVDEDKFGQLLDSIKRTNNILCVGSIGPAKNGKLVVEALSYLKESGCKLNLTWIGEKVKHIKERRQYLDQMEDLIEKYELTTQWTWRAPTKSIENEYSNYKVLILASTTEGLPNVVCEAQYLGLPCIVSNVLDHPNLIRDGKTGYLFDPNSAVNLSEKILQIYSLNEVDYRTMCENSLENGRKLFASKTFVEKYQKLLLKHVKQSS